MKMFLKILKYRFISSLKHPVVLVCLLAALISSVFVGIFAQKNYNDVYLYPIAIVDEDGGEYARLFIDQIKTNKQVDVKLYDIDKAIKQVSTGKIDGTFILLDSFSDKIKNNDYHDIVEFISPSVTTSAYPVSEIMASEIIDLWLIQLVKNTLFDLHKKLGDGAAMSYEDVVSKIDIDYKTQDIITIEYIGDDDGIFKKADVRPIDKAIGVYAAFVIFAIMLSGEWVFNIKKRGLQSRFISCNTDLAIVCLGSQVASVLVSMMFFVPLIVFLSIYLSVQMYVALYLTIGMLLFSLCICSIAFVISTFVENLTQLVVVGTSVAIINILISSLTMPLPNWAQTAGIVAKIFPGSYLLGCYDNFKQLAMLIGLTIIWVVLGYLSILRIRKNAKA